MQRFLSPGHPPLGDTIPVEGDQLGIVAFIEIPLLKSLFGLKRFFGTNPEASTNAANNANAPDLFNLLKALGLTGNARHAGQMRELYHAEAEALMSAWKFFNGNLPKNIVMYVDRFRCRWCFDTLPKFLKALGIDHLTIYSKDGQIATFP